MSELDYLIPPEILDDEFYYLIRRLAAECTLSHVLEIGSSAGEGSTKAFVEGLSQNPSSPTLYCLEVSEPRFRALSQHYQNQPLVKPYHASSVPSKDFPSHEQVARFYHQHRSNLNDYPLHTVVGWLQQDLDYLENSKVEQCGIDKIKRENKIEHFDLVLIDGSEFTGEAELEAVYGAKIILLDDINGFKNWEAHNRLVEDPRYQLIHENRKLRNGFSAFRLNPDSVQQEPTDRLPVEQAQPKNVTEIFQGEGEQAAELTAQYLQALYLKHKSGKEDNLQHLEDSHQNTSLREEERLPVHFFTIVLNGMPFMKHHIEAMKGLPFEWHWHIVEGVAELTHCTAWGVPMGARIPEEFHRNGLSVDGTSDYLDQLANKFPDHVSVYRKANGEFWRGKIEMINAPVAQLPKSCLLWEIDSDELWTHDQMIRMRDLFLNDSEKDAAYVPCHYFIGPNKYISTIDTWATQPKDWVRVWRFREGMNWNRHEPPELMDPAGRNIADGQHFTRDELYAKNLIFEHPSYVLEQQVDFKEKYYGYTDAVAHWKKLQEAEGGVDPADYLPWAKHNGAVAEAWDPAKGELIFKKYMPTNGEESKVIVAADLAKNTTQDLTAVSTESSFGDAIAEVFQEYRPRKIIESGTYLGTGTTSIIASCLKRFGLSDATFYTIEVNPNHAAQASHNLARQGFHNVQLLQGLSIPRSLLPTVEDIEELAVRNIEFDDLIVDHYEHERAALYLAETDFSGPEDLLGSSLSNFENKPDFVLLDSAGHMGNLEFNYVLDRLEGECIFALDDIHHLKHRRSYLQMMSDPRFKVLTASTEKFGFCVAKFTPLDYFEVPPENVCPEVKSVAVIRADAIGDSVLSLPLFPVLHALYPNAKVHVVCRLESASVFQACPYINSVLDFDFERFSQNEEYQLGLVRRVQALELDILINSVYSSNSVVECIASNSEAKKKVGLRGDLTNIDRQGREEANTHYQQLVDTPEHYGPEIHRHRDLLQGLGAKVHYYKPLIWTTIQDEAFAEKFFKQHNLDRSRCIAFFAGAQSAFRSSEYLGIALKNFAEHEDFELIALGSAADHKLNEEQGLLTGKPYVNMCGKTSIRQAAAIMKRVRLALGAETSLAHIACATDTSQVITIGGGHFGRFMPYSASTSLACLPLNCFTCNWHCHFAKKHCLRDLSPRVITAALKDTWMRKSKKPRVFTQKNWQNMNGEAEPRRIDLSQILDPQVFEIIPI